MTSNSKELIERLTARLGYDSTGRDQFVSRSETIVKKDDLRELLRIARPTQSVDEGGR